jgi:hypothetical protein
VRHELPFFDGLRQVHIHRLAVGEKLVWPEVEALEKEQVRAELRAAMGH